MSRGNGGDSLFRSDVDRHRFLRGMGEMPAPFSLEVHAFVLIDNYYPLFSSGWTPTPCGFRSQLSRNRSGWYLLAFFDYGVTTR